MRERCVRTACCFIFLSLVLSACDSDAPTDNGSDGGATDGLPPPPGNFLLTVTPTPTTARQHMGGPGEAPLVFELHAPANLHGGGLPATLGGGDNVAIVELELPTGGTTDEDAKASTGLISFD